ncbi:Palmitoyl-protein thioesterase [Spironucleus salmonicida]|uniref:Palmitoyl-protein thioesterase n=1 Tax=Spironucleus salmonicida TaxID=348837 RepID=V6LCM8_9EUKA|nr:Palmitoyl-protein thioesterase [Spironucleus salmonicida]|eukprot:EST41431.1 Palmitoyl-protein thioesterase [Spironucleus salmonicida]
MLAFILAQYPIVLIHGFDSHHQNMEFMKGIIEREISGVIVINCEIGRGKIDSIFMDLQQQIKLLSECISEYPVTLNGYIGVGHSQGGYLMRALLEDYNHRISPMVRFISLAGPQGGFFCGIQSKCKGNYLPYYIEKLVQIAEYTNLVQTHLGPSQYWRNPYKLEIYTEKAKSQPLIDNIKDYDEQRKVNFMSVDKIVLFGGPQDETIQPWQSTFFGVWKQGSDSEVQLYHEREEYLKDTFGLRSMVEQDRVVFEVTNLEHGDYKYNENFIVDRLMPHLRMN